MADTKYFYTWQECDADIAKIAEWAKDKNFTGIYGIPRGGLGVAVMLSHFLGLPMKFVPEEIDAATLVVDDISDSGKTLVLLAEKLSHRPVVATLFYHTDTAWMPDFTVRQKLNWVVFPWETVASSKYDNTLEQSP